MSKSMKLYLLAACGIIAIPLVAAVVFLQFVDNTKYKQQLEERASEASEMQVSIAGPLQIDLFPKLRVVLNDLHMVKDGQELVSVKNIDVGFDLLPLLHKEFQINSIHVVDPVIAVTRLMDGSYNIRKQMRYTGTLPTLDLEEASITNGTISLDDQLAATKYEAQSCNIDVTELGLEDSTRAEILQHLALTAELGCGVLRKDAIELTDLSIIAKGREGRFVIEPMAVNLFGSAGSGNLQADFSSDIPSYEFVYSLPQFQTENFLAAFFPKQTITGNVDFHSELTMKGATLSEVKETLTGTLSLRGQGMTLHGIDLDEELAQFESTQNFSLIDMGALFFAGPLGLAVTKGYDYASLFQRTDSNSEITILVSDWTVANGVAKPLDVAMATNENIMAVKGGLDFNQNQFDELTIALLDASGCASVQQVVRGSFRAPEIEKPGFLMALAGPAISLIKEGVELLPGEDVECEPFYQGSLIRSQ